MYGQSDLDREIALARSAGEGGHTHSPSLGLNSIERYLVESANKTALAQSQTAGIVPYRAEPGTFLIIADVAVVWVTYLLTSHRGYGSSSWPNYIVGAAAIATMMFGSVTYDVSRRTRALYTSVFSVTNALVLAWFLTWCRIDSFIVYLVVVPTLYASMLLHYFLLRLPTPQTEELKKELDEDRSDAAYYHDRVKVPSGRADPFRNVWLEKKYDKWKRGADWRKNATPANERDEFNPFSALEYFRTHVTDRNLVIACSLAVLAYPVLQRLTE